MELVKAASPERETQCAHAREALKAIKAAWGKLDPRERPKVYALAYKGYTAQQIIRSYLTPIAPIADKHEMKVYIGNLPN